MGGFFLDGYLIALLDGAKVIRPSLATLESLAPWPRNHQRPILGAVIKGRESVVRTIPSIGERRRKIRRRSGRTIPRCRTMKIIVAPTINAAPTLVPWSARSLLAAAHVVATGTQLRLLAGTVRAEGDDGVRRFKNLRRGGCGRRLGP